MNVLVKEKEKSSGKILPKVQHPLVLVASYVKF